ncbi:MAG: ribosomal protein S18 acetylase RimI-like enzyme [Polaribacter sp.]|jgi:ribosomal protein S18 acetylase RimI-like enzyme
MIRYTTAKTTADLNGILQLQNENHSTAVSKTEANEEGFVTVKHNLVLLEKLNSPHPHIVAKDGESIAGYALVMLENWRNEIPILIPMFEEIDKITYQEQSLKDARYFTMGQICIGKDYRGQGVFAGLYMEMSRLMKRHFDFIVTEVSKQNMRSLRAHEKVGFEVVREYEADGETWAIVLLRL